MIRAIVSRIKNLIFPPSDTATAIPQDKLCTWCGLYAYEENPKLDAKLCSRCWSRVW